MEKKLMIGADEFINEYGFSRVRAYQVLHDSSLPVIRLGRRLFVRRADFEAWLDRQSTREEQ